MTQAGRRIVGLRGIERSDGDKCGQIVTECLRIDLRGVPTDHLARFQTTHSRLDCGDRESSLLSKTRESGTAVQDQFTHQKSIGFVDRNTGNVTGFCFSHLRRLTQSDIRMVETWELRARFAAALAKMYGDEVPAYNTLVDVTMQVNRDFAAEHPDSAERLGSLARVSTERHGAIRLGTLDELRDVATVFGGFGMFPVGYYDLRLTDSPIPVVSTAFRPTDPAELARNPFRVFTSVLTSSDSRFFDTDLERRITRFLRRRTLFSPELLQWARQSSREGGLTEPEATQFVDAATSAFRLGTDPIDAGWYRELAAISPVAADIAGQGSTHVNHLTPRVLDIDELYRRMTERGITMIDRIQGPPRWSGPPLLLRQTSFRALAEDRLFRQHDGSVTTEPVRVRFGEVEARGIALTRSGRAIYDRLIATPEDADWDSEFPHSESELDAAGLAYFTFRTEGTVVVRDPIVYEDFLPASAAGIFASNLDSVTGFVSDAPGAEYGQDRLEGAVDRTIEDPFELYRAQQEASRAVLPPAHNNRGLPSEPA